MTTRTERRFGDLTRREFVGGCGVVLTAGTAFGSQIESDRMFWTPTAYGHITPGGDLHRRAEQNWQRLRHAAYRVPQVFASVTGKEYPGDWVGRALLGTTLLARSTSRDASGIEEIVRKLPSHMNAAGYLGQLLNPRALNELQLGSHGMLIRGMCEYYRWTQDTGVGTLVQTLVTQIARGMSGLFETYPITSDTRKQGQGGVIGEGLWTAGRWTLSSDVGLTFILLDGLTQAWEIDRNPAVKAVIDEGVDRFSRMDLVAVQAHAHSSLSALRAAMRLYRLTGERRLLRLVQDRYALYRREAMTENYANYNWFGRPNTWTEPCGIVDSFMVATQLWQHTGTPQYLEDAHLIWFNGMGHGQRATGGFGPDSCAGVNNPFLGMSMYEAYFCCTMRGGEGLSYAVQCSYFTRGKEIAIAFYGDSAAHLELDGARLAIEQATQYPYDGSVRLRVRASDARAPVTFRLFIPPWFSEPHLRLNGEELPDEMEAGFRVARFVPKAGDVLMLTSTLNKWTSPTFARNPNSLPGYSTYYTGPLLLGYSGDGELHLPEDVQLVDRQPGVCACTVKGREITLSRINYINELPTPSQRDDPLEIASHLASMSQIDESAILKKYDSRRQILFKA
jgi:hypothetical protein